MGFRWHLYKFDDRQVKQQLKKYEIVDFNDVLCVERNLTFSNAYAKATPLPFAKKLPFSYKGDYQLRVLSKSALHKLILDVFTDFQQYIISSLINKEDALGSVDLSDESVWRRCCGVDATEEDKQVATHYGIMALQNYWAIYCSKTSKDRFIQLLEKPNEFLGDNTMFHILIQLVYLYKTWDKHTFLVMAGW